MTDQKQVRRKLDMTRIEANVINFISAVSPWIAPLIPAYLVHDRMLNNLGYLEPFPTIGALAVELIGLSSVYTAVSFWRYNDSHKTNKAPLIPALFAGLFYISIIITVNVVLDANIGTERYDGIKILAHALLSLLSIDAALIIALRASHARNLTDESDAKEQQREERQKAKQAELAAKVESESVAKAPVKTPSITYAEYVALNKSRNGEGPITAIELKKQYGVSNSSAYRWEDAYYASLGIPNPNKRKAKV